MQRAEMAQMKATGSQSHVVSPGGDPSRVLGPDIFIVHGHDEGRAQSIARWLEHEYPAYRPVILHEQPEQGRTLIEKLEHHAENAVYAVILVTGDDAGGIKPQVGETPDAIVGRMSPRARQNVVLELGMFYGRLGRSRVAVLYEEGVELPSDIHGIIYILLDHNDGWKDKLRREFAAAGLERGERR